MRRGPKIFRDGWSAQRLQQARARRRGTLSARRPKPLWSTIKIRSGEQNARMGVDDGGERGMADFAPREKARPARGRRLAASSRTRTARRAFDHIRARPLERPALDPFDERRQAEEADPGAPARHDSGLIVAFGQQTRKDRDPDARALLRIGRRRPRAQSGARPPHGRRSRARGSSS